MKGNVLILFELYQKQLDTYNYSETKLNSREILQKTQSWAYMMSINLELLGYSVKEFLISNNLKNIIRKIRDHKIKILIVENARKFFANDLIILKKEFPDLILITHYCSAIKQTSLDYLKFYDKVLCCSPHFLNTLQIPENKKILFYNASPGKGFQLKKEIDQKIIACSFFGSLFSNIHKERKKLLAYLLKENLSLDVYSSFEGSTKISSLKNKLNKKGFLNNYFSSKLSEFEKKYMILRHVNFSQIKNQLFDEEMLSKMSKYICTLNVHTEDAKGFAANLRLFEAASVGTCLITENFPNLKDLFEPDYEILTYSSREECLEKILYCLNNPQLAYEIGHRAYIRAKKNHTYTKRVKELSEHFDIISE